MKRKAKSLAPIVDSLMTALLLGQMGYHMMDNRMHEYTGIALCLLFILHHVLNFSWHRNLPRGRYSLQRKLMLVINLLTAVAMIFVMVSAVLVSRRAFSFLGLHMRGIGRRMHMPATMWLFVLTGLHLGLHGSMLVNRISKHIPRKVILAAIDVAALFGTYQFVHRQLYMELFMLREFAFLDYGEPFALFMLSYLSMFILFAVLSAGMMRLCTKKKETSGRES
mgnify:CR=1 FL=1